MADVDSKTNGAPGTRRSLVKAAAIALGALLALTVNRKSWAQDDNQGGGNNQGGGGGPCFLRGTRIRTQSGYRNVEDLAVGEFLPTAFRGLSAIRRINSHCFNRNDPAAPWPEEARPVRVMRSAIDDNVPDMDLYLTAAHALFIDGVLIPVGNLINGTTITLDEAHDHDVLEYFHVELEGHDVIDVQSMPCETLREMDVPACAPLLGFNGRRNEVKSRLRSAISPWVDRRQLLDAIRDRIEGRGIAASQNMMLHGSRAKCGSWSIWKA